MDHATDRTLKKLTALKLTLIQTAGAGIALQLLSRRLPGRVADVADFVLSHAIERVLGQLDEVDAALAATQRRTSAHRAVDTVVEGLRAGPKSNVIPFPLDRARPPGHPPAAS